MRHGRPLSFLWPDSAFVPLPGLVHMAHHFAPEAVLAAVAAAHTARCNVPPAAA